MSSRTLTRPTWTDFITWATSIDPGITAECTRLGTSRVTIRVELPDGTNYWINQDQTLTVDGPPWTAVVT